VQGFFAALQLLGEDSNEDVADRDGGVGVEDAFSGVDGSIDAEVGAEFFGEGDQDANDEPSGEADEDEAEVAEGALSGREEM